MSQDLDRLIATERATVGAALASEDSMIAGIERLRGDLDAGALPKWGEPSSGAAGASAATKVVIALALLGGGGAAGWYAHTRSSEPTIHVAAGDRSAPPEQAAEAPQEPLAGAASPGRAPVDPPPSDASVTSHAPVDPTELRAADDSADDNPGESVSASADTSQRSATPKRKHRSSKKRRSGDTQSAAEASPTEDTGSDLGAQLAVLRKAEAASRAGRHAEVRRLVRSYTSSFASRMFDEDMAALDAVAQCAARTTTGAEVASAFGRRFPRSIHRARVRDACGEDSG